MAPRDPKDLPPSNPFSCQHKERGRSRGRSKERRKERSAERKAAPKRGRDSAMMIQLGFSGMTWISV